MQLPRDRSPARRRARLLGAACIVALTLLPFWPVGGHSFLAWDDGDYVSGNDVVRGGLSAASLRWSLTTLHAANWHPLTWLSHMLDVQLFGLDAGAHHLSSLAVHLAAAVALAAVLFRLTGSLWRSVLVAALFAVHPLHVESVARVSTRKDVLAGLFWVLTIAAYLRYVRRPGTRRYLLVILVYSLALMTKPTVVPLPLVLLLLDFWPLGRLATRESGLGARAGMLAPARLLLEKLPLLALAGVSSALTLLAQTGEGKASATLAAIPLSLRLDNAAFSGAVYLADLFFPRGLAFFYPYPIDGLPLTAVTGSASVLAGLTLMAVRQRRRRPFLLAGWGWYLVTLLPAIGIVQVGLQARADRYTYLPLIGAFVFLVWSGASLAARPPRRRTLAAAGCLIALMSAALAHRQVATWRDTETMARHAIAVTSGNWVAHVDLGADLLRQGRNEEGLQQYREAAALIPARAQRHFLRAQQLAGEGRDREAGAEYARAADLFPPFVAANFNLGLLAARSGDAASASRRLLAAIGFQPDFAEAHFARGVVLAQAGEWEEAAAHFAEVLRHRPDYPGARHNLEVVLDGLGYGPERVEDFIRESGQHPDMRRWTAR